MRQGCGFTLPKTPGTTEHIVVPSDHKTSRKAIYSMSSQEFCSSWEYSPEVPCLDSDENNFAGIFTISQIFNKRSRVPRQNHPHTLPPYTPWKGREGMTQGGREGGRNELILPFWVILNECLKKATNPLILASLKWTAYSSQSSFFH